jgi:hypothetical protein
MEKMKMTFIGHDLYYTGLTVLCDKFAVGGRVISFIIGNV